MKKRARRRVTVLAHQPYADMTAEERRVVRRTDVRCHGCGVYMHRRFWKDHVADKHPGARVA